MSDQREAIRSLPSPRLSAGRSPNSSAKVKIGSAPAPFTAVRLTRPVFATARKQELIIASVVAQKVAAQLISQWQH